MHGESVVLALHVHRGPVRHQRNVRPDHVQREIVRHQNPTILSLDMERSMLVGHWSVSILNVLTDQVDNVLVLVLPVVDGQVVVDLQLQAGATGVAHNAQTAVHVLHVAETPPVLQPPHLVASRVLLVSHPDVVLVRLHSQHPPALQHGLDILPGPWGGTSASQGLTRLIVTWLRWGRRISCGAEPDKSANTVRPEIVLNNS